jgi:hypothetical protein
MPAKVFRIQLAEFNGGQPHPHVLVLSSSRNCIVVPACTIGKIWAESYIAAMRKLFYPPEQIAVRIDNSRHVAFKQGYTGNIAYWFPFPLRQVPRRVIDAAEEIGEMSDVALLAIVKCFLSRPGTGDLSPADIRRLESLRLQLEAAVATLSPSDHALE